MSTESIQAGATRGNICFFFNDTATTEIYTVSDTLSLHDALPICPAAGSPAPGLRAEAPSSRPRSPSGRCRSEEHTSELQSPDTISYAVFCLKKKKKNGKKKHDRIDIQKKKKK